ncbi:MAG: TetR/AcrR family transcriptional regulator [Actinomycetota bacterium]
MGVDTRERILDGAGAAVVRFGLAKTSLEDVAAAAGVSRATVYRWFPGGRDEVFDALVGRELAKVADEMIERIERADDLGGALAAVLRWGGAAIRSHELLQASLDSAPDELAVRLARFEHGPTDLVVPALAERLLTETGRTPEAAHVDATYLAMMLLSLIANPGSWDLDDDRAVARLVDTQLLGAVGG